MSYTTPKIKSVAISDLLSQLGPARAMLYTGGGSSGGGKDDEGADC